MKNTVKKKKMKIRFDRLFIFLFGVFLLCLIIFLIFNIKIKNIYVTGDFYLSEQEIIEISMLSYYPSSLKNPCSEIEKRLEENYMIVDANVYKNGLGEVHIEIIENRPLFYYESISKTVHIDGTSSDYDTSVPVVMNYITDSYYDAFIGQMKNLDLNILSRISEVKFVPTEADDNRFLLYMSDGNYVYINIDTFDKLNKYLTILESLPDENGILYLDYGNNFEILK